VQHKYTLKYNRIS